MINYTERITEVMHDVVARTPALSFIDLREVLVFARYGRTGADGDLRRVTVSRCPKRNPGITSGGIASPGSSSAAPSGS